MSAIIQSLLAQKIAAGGASSLLTGLEGYWKLDEASGTRSDSTANANHLTDNNTVASTTGKVGNAARFVRANSESLTIADNASLSVSGSSFTICCWIRLSDHTNNAAIISKVNASTIVEYALIYSTGAGDILLFRVQDASYVGGTVLPENSLSYGALANNTWYFVACGYDSVSQKVWIRVGSGGTLGAITEAACTATLPDGNAAFTIGDNPNYAGSIDGDTDEVGFWRRHLTDPELDTLFNSGAGTTYPF